MPSTRVLAEMLGYRAVSFTHLAMRAGRPDLSLLWLSDSQAVNLLAIIRTHRMWWPRGPGREGFFSRITDLINDLSRALSQEVPQTVVTGSTLNAAAGGAGSIANTDLIIQEESLPVSPPVDVSPVVVGVGADPEFVWVVGGEFKAFRPRSTGGEVGTDGDGGTGELRPRWNIDPLKVYERIDALISKVGEFTKKKGEIVAGSGHIRSTGGHIHISGLGHEPSRDLLLALDKFIYYPLRSRSNGRVRGSYDRPSQWRSQPHGWEYRSPPSWLAHPILTKGVLVIAAILARWHEIIPNDEEALADLAPNVEERSAVEGFYAFLTALERKGKKLEDLEVLRQWGKRATAVVKSSPAAVVTPLVETAPPAETAAEQPLFRVQVSSDTNMPQNIIRGRSTEFGFVGAGANRTPESEEDVVFVPRRIGEEGRARLQAHLGINVNRWELRSIGLSIHLRRTEANARRVITQILEVLDA